MAAVPPTPVTILGRLRRDPRNQGAWAELVRTYGQTVHQWCRRHQLAHHEAEDVTQNVLMRLVESLATHYDPEQRFRIWLRACTRNAVIDFVRHLEARPDAALRCGRALEVLGDQPAKNSLADVVETQWDLELFQAACQSVRSRLRQPQTWEAFRLTLPVELGGEGLDAGEAASRLNVPTQRVYDARTRVRELVQAEIQRLEQDA